MTKKDFENVYGIVSSDLLKRASSNIRNKIEFSDEDWNQIISLFYDLHELITMKIGYPFPEKERWVDAI